MAVYKRSYRPYEGGVTPERWRFLVLMRYALSGFFDSRPFTAFFALSFLPFLLAFATIYISHSAAVAAMLHFRGPSPVEINNYFFAIYLSITAWFSFLLITWQGPQLVSNDLANNALVLILSRPLSRTEYVLGKFSAIALLLSLQMWVPTLILFFLQAGLEGNGWLGTHFWMIGSILLASWMWIAIVGLMVLAASAWLKWRVAASALMLAIFFVGPGFATAINLTLNTSWGFFFDIGTASKLIYMRMFRVPLDFMKQVHMLDFPLWACWLTVGWISAAALLLLNRRLKAREVVRG